MTYFVDIAYNSITKYGEELCGDKVEIIRQRDKAIVVMADGLGSGVNANILSTFTSKTAITMLKEGASIYETIDTIINALPVCKARKLAYSTFTIVEIFDDGKAYVAEYENPPIYLFRDGKIIPLEKEEIVINGTTVKKSYIQLEIDDLLVIISDGVVHAGVGGALNLGWQWKNVGEYLNRNSQNERSARKISRNLVDICQYLYMDKPGDDTTVVSIKIRKPEIVDLFTGPPKDLSKDSEAIIKFMKGSGKKVVCGGTAAKIVARELNKRVIPNMEFIDPEIPPIAEIEGIDLVTEGVITLNKAIEKIKKYIDSPNRDNLAQSLNKEDGASKLAKILIEECTHLNLWFGKAVNPAHQNPDFPIDLSVKLKIVHELIRTMEKLGTKVSLRYV
ncbi:SpoIIE family protein phosphatase [Anaerosalibacter sp. Marseille-P3206]|uniref:SpoIIE family protein phosphatase n=1 Tax=Anaerosalibacter sp. Marseille-P3206 TaxID=1871005 RepID=UPI0009852A1C|nr:SpoIIE family protein phosphatase [Anaerosalibacter sp. Marseille-P3206]